MKNVYEPDNEDILNWVAEASSDWPASDWDYYVMNGKNDELVFSLASNNDCIKRDFFIHSLYYLVGDYFNESKKNIKKRERINTLLKLANTNATPEIQKWEQETTDLLSGKLAFNVHYWLNYMFYSL